MAPYPNPLIGVMQVIIVKPNAVLIWGGFIRGAADAAAIRRPGSRVTPPPR